MLAAPSRSGAFHPRAKLPTSLMPNLRQMQVTLPFGSESGVASRREPARRGRVPEQACEAGERRGPSG